MIPAVATSAMAATTDVTVSESVRTLRLYATIEVKAARATNFILAYLMEILTHL